MLRSRCGDQVVEVKRGRSRCRGQGVEVKVEKSCGKVMVRRSRWQEAEAIDHIASMIMEQRGMNFCSSPFLYLCSPGS